MICRILLGIVFLSFVEIAEAQTNTASSSGPRTYPTRGLVREIPENGNTVVVRHEEIPGFMPKMTMELVVKNTNDLSKIKEGDVITFNLVVNEDDHFIDQIRKVGSSTETNAPAKVPASPHLSELGPGDAMPEVALIDENGKSFKLSDFHGQAVAFTFIFSRCPLPDYCPRMNKHFARARELLKQNNTAPANWQFLSISFDAEFDTPKVLKSYGDTYRGNRNDRWLFAAIAPEALNAVAPRLDFRFGKEAGTFSHNLRTVVLDSKGRIFKQFDNNTWSAEDLAKAMAAAAKQP